ncbi:MAG: hypothetical protein II720_01735 [Bacteroidales bacterium]|nr:hypothetical protein [Bacteroidales bacterium]
MTRLRMILALAALAVACTGKDPDVGSFAVPAIEQVSVVPGEDYSRISIVCQVSSPESIKEYGILFGETDLRSIPGANLKDGRFSVAVDGLEYSSKYIYQAYIDGGRGPVYSKVGTWETVDEVPPVPSIIKATRGYGADAGKVTLDCFIGELAGTSGKDALQCGICYSPEGSTPAIEGASLAAAGFSESGDYIVVVEGLVTSASYVFRPYTKIGKVVSYGEPLTLRIPSGADVVLTERYSDVGLHSVTLEGVLAEQVDDSEQLALAFELGGKMYMAKNQAPDRHFFTTLDNLTPDTEYSFRAVARIGDNTFYGESMSFRTLAFQLEDADYIDMGVSVLWATCNLGATSPSDTGDRYAWGDTTPGQNMTWETYKWCLGSRETIFKYTLSRDNPQADNKAVLDPEDDAATAALGGKWRMPTEADYNDLLLHCTYVRTTVDDKDGFILTSTVPGFEDQSIFIPNTTYWTSELCTASSVSAKTFAYWMTVEDTVFYKLRVKDITIESDYWGRDNDESDLSRRVGRCIRPVLDR